MARRLKNLSFPIVARRLESTDQDLVGSEKIEFLEMMTSLEKNEQYILYYNFLNEQRIRAIGDQRRPYYVKSNNRSRQTTFVLDFDNLTPSSIEPMNQAFEAFNAAVNGKAQLLVSPSGNRHVLYVVGGPASAKDYERIQKMVVDRFFKVQSYFLDKGVSYSLNTGFFHSQHLYGWIHKKMINISPSEQGARRNFWKRELEINFTELMNLIDECSPPEQRGIHELAEDVHRMIRFIHTQNLRGVNLNEDQETELNTERLLRGLAEIGSREEGFSKFTKEISTRAQTEEYKTTLQYIESIAGKTVQRASRLSTVRDFLAQRAVGRRIDKDSDTNESNQDGDGEDSVPRASREGDGRSDSRDSGDDGNKGTRPGDDFSNEHVLGIISDVKARCESRNFNVKKLGDLIWKNSLRGNGYWDTISEESDIKLLFSVLREALAGDSRIPESFRASPERLFIWLRHAGRYLRSVNSDETGLRSFAADAARCWRLCLKAQNVEVTLTGKEFSPERRINQEKVAAFVKELHKNIDFLVKDLPKDKRQTILKMFREDLGFLERGSDAFLTRISSLYPIILKDMPVALGMEDFQEFFQTHNKKASALRHVFMSFCGNLAKDYTPCYKRREFYVDLCTIEDFIEISNSNTPSRTEDLIVLLGNGRTWDTIKKFTKPMLMKLGLSKSRDIWYRALELSTANEPEKRKKDVDAFLDLLTKQREHADYQQGRSDCHNANGRSY